MTVDFLRRVLGALSVLTIAAGTSYVLLHPELSGPASRSARPPATRGHVSSTSPVVTSVPPSETSHAAGTPGTTVPNVLGSQARRSSAPPAAKSASAADTCSGVPVPAGSDVQSAINAYPSGTTFCLAPGLYYVSSVSPKTGDVIDGDNRAAVLDGRGSAQYAILGSSSAPGVTIRGLTIQNYKTPLQQGALQSFGTTGWVIQNNHITRNAAAGVTFDGGAQVLGNLLDYNTQEGYACHGNNDVFSGNEIAYNNQNRTVSWGWEAGGGKCWATQHLTMSNNYSHDNGGPGLWTDTDNVFTTYTANTVTDNYGPGIMHEISWSATITGNTISGNGFGDNGGWLWDAGILISSSGGQDANDPIVISGNRVINNYNAISILQQNRGGGLYGTHQVQNVNVSNNKVTMNSGMTGVADDNGDTGIWTRNVTFDMDAYAVGNPSASYWAWEGANRTWSQWRSFGHDTRGSVTDAGSS